MSTHHSPTTRAEGSDADAEFEVVRRDAVLAGRAICTGEYLAGLIVAAQVATVGTPDKLARDLWPDADPALVDEVWQRALVVGYHLRGLAGRPQWNGPELARSQEQLEAAGHEAMRLMVGRARSTPVLVHPADGEFGGRGHDEA